MELYVEVTLKKIALALSVLALLVFLAVAQEDVNKLSKLTGMTPGMASRDSGFSTAPVGSVASIAGDWTLALDDAGTKSLKLMLYQNNDAVFGQEILLYRATQAPSAQVEPYKVIV